MKLYPAKLGVAAAVTAGLLWVVCSLLVLALPGGMINMSGHMVHADLSQMSWTLTFVGFLLGLVIWSVVAYITGWLIGMVYNMLL